MISLLKSFKKKSLKAKIGIILAFAVILLLLVYVIYSNFKPEPPAEYDIAKVSRGTVVDYLDVNGIVESGYTDNFMAVDGVLVEEVFVSVGDSVKKGDKIATFNASSALAYVNTAKAEYEKALNEYNQAVANAENNVKRKQEIKVEIEEVNKAIAAKQAEVDSLSKELEGKKYVSSIKQQELMQKNSELLELQSRVLGLYAEDAAIILTDEKVTNALQSVSEVKKAEYERIEKIYNDMKNGWYATTDGIVTTVNLKPGEKFVPTKEVSNSTFDISSFIETGMDEETKQLISSLLGGETAPVGSGVTVESYDGFIVSVTVGKADLLKVKKGMKAIVNSLDSEYEAEVIYVSATATDNSNGLGLDSITSLMGGTGGASGAEVKIKIKNPDSKIVIGFDVDIKIILGVIEDTLIIPVESVVYNSGVYSVFVYNEEDGTITKRAITKGLLDDTHYEILEGLSEGEMVVKSPDPNMEDGTVIKEKNS